MSPENKLDAKIINSQEAVRAHMECAMPHRRAEWAKELKRRRRQLKAAVKAAPPPPPPVLGLEKSILESGPGGHPPEPGVRGTANRTAEEEGIESYWSGWK